MADAVVHRSQQRDAGDAPPELKPKPDPGDTTTTASPAIDDAGNDMTEGIALRRLLAVATLNPAQGGLLAMDLVDTLAELEQRGDGPEQVTDRSVMVRRDGTLLIAPVAENGSGAVSATTANALVRLLMGHTRGGSARRKVEAELLTGRLAGTFTEITELREKVRTAVAELRAEDDTSWDDWAAVVRRQIGALVRATEGHTALRDRPAPPKPDDTEATNAVAESARTLNLARGDLRGARRKAWHRKRRLPGRRGLLIGLVVVLLAVTGWWAVPEAWSELRRGWEAVFTTEEPSQQLPPVSPPKQRGDGGTTGKSAEAAQPVTDRPEAVPRLGPEKAGPINGVTIERAEGACTRAAICPLRVDVMLDPTASPRDVSWSLRVVDRCTGEISTRQGVSMTARSGWQQVYGISRPTLPGSPALAIVAVTEAPATAASAPLYVTADRATC